MRLFVAIDIPTHTKNELISGYSEVKARLDTAGRGAVKWVQPQNWHITLKFLGEVPEKLYERCTYILTSCAHQYTPFKMRIRHMGCFPTPKRPKVLWAGVEEAVETLSPMSACLEEAFEEIGIAREERGFHAHLTFGRVKKFAPGMAQAVVDCLSTRVQSDWFEVRNLNLYKSVLTPKGPIYSLIFKASLADR